MRADIGVRVMKQNARLPILTQVWSVSGRNKTELNKTLRNMKRYYNRLYIEYKTYFTIEITEE